MLRCIAIDDEPLALELLEDNIRKVPFLELVASFNSPLEAVRILHEQPVDLVFLDIQMPGLNGLQFIRSAPGHSMFILVTAYEKYAMEGYDLNVVDYLLKPVELDRFIKACNKALELHNLKIRKAGSDEPAVDFFFVPADYSLVKIPHAQVSWIEGLKDYVRIHLINNQKPVITRMSMKGIEDLLPSNKFFRVHKSYIVSIAAITSVRKTSVFIGEMELPLGDNHREDFFKQIGRPG